MMGDGHTYDKQPPCLGLAWNLLIAMSASFRVRRRPRGVEGS